MLAGLPQSVVMNGVNCSVFSHKECREIRTKLALPQDKKIILHVTSAFSDQTGHIKGGHHLITLAEQLQDENVCIFVAGNYDVQSMLPENITLLGPIRDQQLLAEYYAAADLTVVVSQRETFGMSVAESMCCGTPVVGFESGGSESIALPQYSEFVPFGDVQQLKDIICAKWMTYKNEETSREIAIIAAQTYKSERMAEEYFAVYQSMVQLNNY